MLLSIFVSAELSLNIFNKSIDIDKTQKDYLISKMPLTMENGHAVTQELNPEINMFCSASKCEYSVFLDNIISSYNNIVSRQYCFKYNNSDVCEKFDDKGKCELYEKICSEIANYNISVMESKISQIVADRLIQFANNSISEDENKKLNIEMAKGNLLITSK